MFHTMGNIKMVSFLRRNAQLILAIWIVGAVCGELFFRPTWLLLIEALILLVVVLIFIVDLRKVSGKPSSVGSEGKKVYDQNHQSERL